MRAGQLESQEDWQEWKARTERSRSAEGVYGVFRLITVQAVRVRKVHGGGLRKNRKDWKIRCSWVPHRASSESRRGQGTQKGQLQWQRVLSHRLSTVPVLLKIDAQNSKLFSSELTVSLNKAQEYLLKYKIRSSKKVKFTMSKIQWKLPSHREVGKYDPY